MVQVPVALIFFQRETCAVQVMETLQRARPRVLYLIADGPRPGVEGDSERCQQVRKRLEDMVNWPCEVRKVYSDENLGCRMRPVTGISRVLQEEQEVIVLEEDIVADPSFFPFCEAMLKRYRDNPEVMMVSGANRLGAISRDHSFGFSRYAQIWGWATWRRAWKHYDISLARWAEMKTSTAWVQSQIHPAAKNLYSAKLDEIVEEGLDAWDYGWSVTMAMEGGVSVIPAMNLTRHIGYGFQATHTLNPLAAWTQPAVGSLEPPYALPEAIDVDEDYDRRFIRTYQSRWTHLREKAFRKVMQWRAG